MEEENPSQEKEGFGPVVGAIIIVGLFIMGGLYFFFMQGEKLSPPPQESQAQS